MGNLYLIIAQKIMSDELDSVVLPISPIKLTSLAVSEEYKFSETAGYFSLGYIGSVTKPGEMQEFMYFLGFEPEV